MLKKAINSPFIPTCRMFKKAISATAASEEPKCTLGYIEAGSDARTKLRAFFNIRLDIEASEEELAQMPHPLP